MASNSGTLFQYFKNKEQPTARVTADRDEDTATTNKTNTKKRKEDTNFENKGKRRKLSLARLREKQKNNINEEATKSTCILEETLKGKETTHKENIAPAAQVHNYEKVMIEQVKKTLNFAEAETLNKIMRKPKQRKPYVMSDSEETDPIGLDSSGSNSVTNIHDDQNEHLPAGNDDNNPSSMEVEPGTAKRRSSRTKKPVERFIIDDVMEEKPKKPRKIKRSSKMESNNSSSDELMVIEESKRQSVRDVLTGNRKQKATALKRPMTSTMMLQEAKQLIELSSKSSGNVLTRPSISTTVSSVKKQEILPWIWPRVSHTNAGSCTEVLHHLKLKNGDEGVSLCPSDLFKYNIFQPKEDAATPNLSYDECLEEFKSFFPQSELEDKIELYRNITKARSINVHTGIRTVEEDTLWCDIYSPTDYRHLTGNSKIIKQLYKWLETWKQKLLNPKLNSTCSDSSEYEDSETESNWLDNVVLLRGPYGSGKSGIIKTLSSQLGYKIIESNSSTERTGKNVAEIFSEACQSHSVMGKSGAADFSQVFKEKKPQISKRGSLDSFFGRKNSKKKKPSKNSGKELKNKRDVSCDVKESTTDVKVNRLTLVVFEEIDIIFDDDRGFYQALTSITQAAKRPIILISNNPHTTLSTDSNFLVLDVNTPKYEKILECVTSLLLSWNVYIPLLQLRQYVQYHNSDLRRIISNLEFLVKSEGRRSQLHKLPITSHLLGIPPNSHLSHFIAQTQQLNILYTRLNETKCKRSRENKPTDKDKLLECLSLYDGYLYLDQLDSENNVSYREFQLYPAELRPDLSETKTEEEVYKMGCNDDRASFEAQLIRTFGYTVDMNFNLCEFKMRDVKKYTDIKEQHCHAAEMVGDLNCHYDYLSGVRTMCQTERLRAEGNTKRRFLHYFQKDLKEVTREKLADLCLSRDSL